MIFKRLCQSKESGGSDYNKQNYIIIKTKLPEKVK